MKKTLILMLGMVATVSASADKYITLQQEDGTERSLPLSSLSITFQNGHLVANSADEAFQLDLNTMKAMWFAATPTGIEEVSAYDIRNTKDIAVYDLEGRRLSTTDPMTQGIYIIKSKTETRKVLVK